MRHFKAITMGKAVIMGRKTYESIGFPLPGRKNIVVTRNPAYSAEGCTVVYSLPEALDAARDAEEAVIIGGATLYREALPLVERLYLTFIDATFDGDTYFPDFDPADWKEIAFEAHAPDEQNPYPYRFVIYDRVNHSGNRST